MKHFVSLAKPVPGDVAAVVSPSAALPGLFPWVQELGLRRLRDDFGLVPKEFPTTRQMGSSYEDRARDIMDAFADPQVKVVLSSVGGYDEIGLIKHLDPGVFLAHPKPFFGYSDNTNLHSFLWCLGIPSYYGCSTMVQLGMPGGMHAQTARSLRRALFDSGEIEAEASDQFTDIDLDWADPANLARFRPMEPNEGLIWDGEQDGEGRLWGGCLDTLIGILVSGQALPVDSDLDGAVLYLETSEDLPTAFTVGYFLTALGERGWLGRLNGILVGRPKAWAFANPGDAASRAAYRQSQRDAVVAAVRVYNEHIPIVMNMDFGHTDPQIIIPSGGWARILASSRRVHLIDESGANPRPVV
jgi:muramoyltetrapeptide carboxypeptidase LdcA involved in peptidoglycan recycling